MITALWLLIILLFFCCVVLIAVLFGLAVMIKVEKSGERSLT